MSINEYGTKLRLITPSAFKRGLNFLWVFPKNVCREMLINAIDGADPHQVYMGQDGARPSPFPKEARRFY